MKTRNNFVLISWTKRKARTVTRITFRASWLIFKRMECLSKTQTISTCILLHSISKNQVANKFSSEFSIKLAMDGSGLLKSRQRLLKFYRSFGWKGSGDTCDFLSGSPLDNGKNQSRNSRFLFKLVRSCHFFSGAQFQFCKSLMFGRTGN